MASILWQLYHRQANRQVKGTLALEVQHTVKVGNAIILSVGANDPFSDGHTTGYLDFYDERHRPTFPLTSHTIQDYLMTVWNEPSVPFLWQAGRIVGWMEALMENSPQTFRSFPLAGRVTVLQEV